MKIKWIKGEISCIDCCDVVERLTPNHKRCSGCAKKIALERAMEYAKNLPAEINRKRAKDWYYRNRDYKLSYMRQKYGSI